jgi:quinoprotein glucose dehydrogenase
MTYVWQGRQYVVIANGGYGNFDSPMGDYVTAYALPVGQ